ncbi:MAG: hypothetical protein KDC87_07570 [Planctomycetes bacterium]|nr:hypothetical protein [Planctomycetota bacterium]MCB9871375.1 hypothetical protein [Planctomycetota bacterium]MCB9888629.1 hypothetical protein [Planctomycetota bacterium]
MTPAPSPRRIFLPVQWLISPREDLIWILGSVLVAYGMFFAVFSRVLSVATVTLLWVFVFHGPHFWATLSRTYADREQFRKRRRLLTQSLWWYAVGPAMVGLGLLVQSVTSTAANPGGKSDIIRLFFFLAAVWAFHHVAKQHFGFLALYRAKHREFHKADFLFHKYYLLVSLWMPALILLTNHVVWVQDIPGVLGYYTSYGADGLATIQSTQKVFRVGCTWIFWLAQAAFAGAMILRLIRGKGLNLPILLLLASCVPLSWIVIMHSLESDIPNAQFVLVPILTTYHNIQYHGLVWHYNRQKYRCATYDTETKQRLGWAVPLNHNLLVYAAFGVLYTALTIGFEHYGLALVKDRQGIGLVLSAFFWGFAFHHYYLDSKIWKASEDAELRQLLGFPGPKKLAPTRTPIGEPAAIASEVN